MLEVFTFMSFLSNLMSLFVPDFGFCCTRRGPLPFDPSLSASLLAFVLSSKSSIKQSGGFSHIKLIRIRLESNSAKQFYVDKWGRVQGRRSGWSFAVVGGL